MVSAGWTLSTLVIVVVAARIILRRPKEPSPAYAALRLWVAAPAVFSVVAWLGFVVDNQSAWEWWTVPAAAVALLAMPVLTYTFVQYLAKIPSWLVPTTSLLALAGAIVFFTLPVNQLWVALVLGALTLAPYILGLRVMAAHARAGRGIAAMRQRYGAMATIGLIAVVGSALLWVSDLSNAIGRFGMEGGMLLYAFGISMALTPPERLKRMWGEDAIAQVQDRLQARLEAGRPIDDFDDIMAGCIDGGHIQTTRRAVPGDSQRLPEGLDGLGLGGDTYLLNVGADDALAVIYAHQRVFPEEDLHVLGGIARQIRIARRDAEARAIKEADLQRVQELERMKSDFLQSIGHELGNPLSPMALQVSILRRTANPEVHAGLEVIDRNIQRMKALIQNLSDVGRAQESSMQIDMAPLDASKVVADCVQGMAPEATEKGLRLESAIAPNCMVSADEGRLMQIVGNIVSNAIKYTPEGSVTVSVVSHDEVRIAVKDTGLGFTDEQLANLGQAYARFHTDGIEGTGLGFFVTKSLVAAHGGEIEVQSDGVGLGSTVTVRLPRLEADGIIRRNIDTPAQVTRDQ